MGRPKYRDREFETGSFVEIVKQIDGQTDRETHTWTDREIELWRKKEKK